MNQKLYPEACRSWDPFKKKFNNQFKDEIWNPDAQMWFKTWYHLQPKEKTNGVCKRGGCDSKHDITYILSKNTLNHI